MIGVVVVFRVVVMTLLVMVEKKRGGGRKGLEEEEEDGFVPMSGVNILATWIRVVGPSGLDHHDDCS